VKGNISKYPSDANAHRPQPFKTEKSRRYFFWALREGIITVPYRRTMNLQHRWTVKGMKGGLQQIIGNNAAYGPMVQDPNEQTAYHQKTGWRTTDEVAREETENVLREIKKEVDRLLAS
jgi:hypothetical protein